MTSSSAVRKVAHPAPAVDRGAIWRYEDFAELELLIGERKALALLHIFQWQLAAYSEDLSDADGCDRDCQRIAYDVKSMGGQLGFNLLASVGEKICRSPDRANAGDVRSLLPLPIVRQPRSFTSRVDSSDRCAR